MNGYIYNFNLDNYHCLAKITARKFSNVMPLECRCFSTGYCLSYYDKSTLSTILDGLDSNCFALSKGEYKHFIKQVFFFYFSIKDKDILLDINILHLSVGARGSSVRSTF